MPAPADITTLGGEAVGIHSNSMTRGLAAFAVTAAATLGVAAGPALIGAPAAVASASPNQQHPDVSQDAMHPYYGPAYTDYCVYQWETNSLACHKVLKEPEHNLGSFSHAGKCNPWEFWTWIVCIQNQK